MEFVWNKRARKKAEKKARSDRTAALRLRQIRNAETFSDLELGPDAHFLTGDKAHYFALDIGYPARLICKPIEYDTENGQYIKESITVFEIVDYKEDYHSK